MTAGRIGIPHTVLSANLSALYHAVVRVSTNHHTTTPIQVTQVPTVLTAADENDDWADEIAKELAAMVAKVHRTGGRHAQDKAVTTAYAKKLWDGVEKGYGKPLVTIDYDSPDTKMLGHLMENVYTFSAAKNQQQLRALTNALIDPATNKVRSFSEFKKAAFTINDQHVNQWLKAEYNLAIAGGQMASKWVDFEQNAESLPMLEFDAVMDKQTTATCRGLDGVVKPFNDPFWNIYYPPNHFGCRSTVRQRGNAYKPTADDKFTKPDIPPMFRTNLAKQGLIFPKGHSYYNNTSVLSFGDAAFEKDNLRPGKGTVYESRMSINPKKANDLRHIHEVDKKRDVARLLANHFDTDVFMLPEFPYSKKELRYRYFFPHAKPGTFKQPDFMFNGNYWEMEGYEDDFKEDKVSKMLSKGIKQSPYIILHIRHDAEINMIKNKTRGWIKKNKYENEVKAVLIVDVDGKIHRV